MIKKRLVLFLLLLFLVSQVVTVRSQEGSEGDLETGGGLYFPPDVPQGEIQAAIDATPSFEGTDLQTLEIYSNYIDWSDPRLIDWVSKQDPMTQKRFWNNVGKFKGDKSDYQMWQRMMTQQSVDSWLGNYEFGDITRFLGNLQFSEAVAAIWAFIKGDYGMPELGPVQPEVLQEALLSAGYNVTEMDYPPGTEISRKGDTLIINGNNISLQSLTTGSHTITANADKTVNVVASQNATAITISAANGLVVEFNGDFMIEEAQTVTIAKTVGNETTETTIVNGKGIRYENGELSVDTAEIVFEDRAITNEPRNYKTDFRKFSVEEAEMVYQNGLKVYDVANTTFIMSDDSATMMPENGKVRIYINDSNDNSLSFLPISDLTKVNQELDIKVTELAMGSYAGALDLSAQLKQLIEQISLVIANTQEDMRKQDAQIIVVVEPGTQDLDSIRAEVNQAIQESRLSEIQEMRQIPIVVITDPDRSTDITDKLILPEPAKEGIERITVTDTSLVQSIIVVPKTVESQAVREAVRQAMQQTSTLKQLQDKQIIVVFDPSQGEDITKKVPLPEGIRQQIDKIAVVVMDNEQVVLALVKTSSTKETQDAVYKAIQETDSLKGLRSAQVIVIPNPSSGEDLTQRIALPEEVKDDIVAIALVNMDSQQVIITVAKLTYSQEIKNSVSQAIQQNYALKALQGKSIVVVTNPSQGEDITASIPLPDEIRQGIDKIAGISMDNEQVILIVAKTSNAKEIQDAVYKAIQGTGSLAELKGMKVIVVTNPDSGEDLTQRIALPEQVGDDVVKIALVKMDNQDAIVVVARVITTEEIENAVRQAMQQTYSLRVLQTKPIVTVTDPNQGEDITNRFQLPAEIMDQVEKIAVVDMDNERVIVVVADGDIDEVRVAVYKAIQQTESLKDLRTLPVTVVPNPAKGEDITDRMPLREELGQEIERIAVTNIDSQQVVVVVLNAYNEEAIRRAVDKGIDVSDLEELRDVPVVVTAGLELGEDITGKIALPEQIQKTIEKITLIEDKIVVVTKAIDPVEIKEAVDEAIYQGGPKELRHVPILVTENPAAVEDISEQIPLPAEIMAEIDRIAVVSTDSGEVILVITRAGLSLTSDEADAIREAVQKVIGETDSLTELRDKQIIVIKNLGEGEDVTERIDVPPQTTQQIDRILDTSADGRKLLLVILKAGDADEIKREVLKALQETDLNELENKPIVMSLEEGEDITGKVLLPDQIREQIERITVTAKERAESIVVEAKTINMEEIRDAVQNAIQATESLKEFRSLPIVVITDLDAGQDITDKIELAAETKESVERIVLLSPQHQKIEVIVNSDGKNLTEIATIINSIVEGNPSQVLRALKDVTVEAGQSRITYYFDDNLYEAQLGTINVTGAKRTELIITAGAAAFNITFYNNLQCMKMQPLATYISLETDSRRDFAVLNPMYGKTFSLCLRKVATEEFSVNCTACGVVDFIDTNVRLNGIVDYLRRYYQQESRLVSVHMTDTYHSYKPANATIDLDTDMVLMPSLDLQLERNDALCITHPNNYYTLREMEEGAEVHTFVKLNQIKEPTDSLVLRYENATIIGNVLTHKNIRILSPNHQDIYSILP